MKQKISFLIFFSLLFLSGPLNAQLGQSSVSVVPHYPASAYVINRLLPFTITSANSIEIKSVSLLQGGSDCTIFADVYYNTIFHIYCSNPSLVQAEIVFEVNGQRAVAQSKTLSIFKDSTSSTPDSSGSLFSKGGS